MRDSVGKRRWEFRFILAIICFFSTSFALSIPLSFTYSGTSGPYSATGTFNLLVNVTSQPQQITPNSDVDLTFSLLSAAFTPSEITVYGEAVGTPVLPPNPSSGSVPVVVVSSTDYPTYPRDYGTDIVSCISSKVPGDQYYLLTDIFTDLSDGSSASLTYDLYDPTNNCRSLGKLPGGGRVLPVCAVEVYLGNQKIGELTSANPSFTYTYHLSGTNPVNLDLTFQVSCKVLAGAWTYYSFSGYKSYLRGDVFLYSSQTKSVTATYTITPCQPFSGEIHVPLTIGIYPDGKANQTYILTITNTGSVPFTVNEITAGGCNLVLTPPPTFSLNPGETKQISADISCPNGVSNSLVFTATVTTSATDTCNGLTQISLSNSSAVVILPPPCENFSASFSVPSTIGIYPDGTSDPFTVVISNTGDAPFSSINLGSSECTLVVNVPPTLEGHSSVSLPAKLINCPFPPPGSTTFTLSVSTSATDTCNGLTTLSLSSTSSLVRQDRYLSGEIVDARPNPFTLAGGVGSFTITINNIGDVPLSVKSVNLTSQDFEIVNWRCYDAVVPQGGTTDCDITVRWAGQQIAPRQGTIGVYAIVNTTYAVSNSPEQKTNTFTDLHFTRACGDLNVEGFFFPTPIAFDRDGRAKLNITLLNAGTVPVNITNVTIIGREVNMKLSINPPLVLASGASMIIPAELNTTMPLSPSLLQRGFNISIRALPLGEVCDGSTAYETTYHISVAQVGDLIPIISASPTDLVPGIQASVNVTVKNQGGGDVDDSLLNVSVYGCSHLACKLLWTSTSSGAYWVPLLSPQDEYRVQISPAPSTSGSAGYNVQCQGDERIKIVAAVNNDSSDYAFESNYDNNIQVYRLNCQYYTCEVQGPDELEGVGEEKYHVVCYESNTEIPCSYITDPGSVSWKVTPQNGYITYSLSTTDWNATVEVRKVFADDKLFVTAELPLKGWNKKITCTKTTTVYHDVCEEVI